MFEPLWTTHVSIPLLQIVLVLAVGTLTLILGKLKIALGTYVCGIMYWALFYNPSLKSGGGTFQMDGFSIFFLGFGVAVAFLSLIGLLANQD